MNTISSFFAVVLLGGSLAIAVYAAIRLYQVIRDLSNGALTPRNALGMLFGGFTCLFLAASLLVLGATIIVTLFFMKPGGASGIPLGIALFTLPWAWLLSEFLFAACYTHASDR